MAARRTFISAAGAVVAFVFEMIEKEAEEHGIEVGKHDFRWYTPTPRESEDPPLPNGAIRILPNG